MMHGHEKSDSAIVAVKLANEAEQPAAERSATEPTAAEPVEPRAETKGNACQQTMPWAQSQTKDKLVYGPFQIEARINQNTDISQQLSLWNQLGSRVIRGNMLVIPIDNSILYVSPLYLRAEQGQLPELKRVIASYGDQVVMKETLAAALSALFSEPAAGSSPSTAAAMPVAGVSAERARKALDHYERAIERLKSGDWAGFGTELDSMRDLLQQMSGQESTGK
jgi:uncharacterized protein